MLRRAFVAPPGVTVRARRRFLNAEIVERVVAGAVTKTLSLGVIGVTEQSQADPPADPSSSEDGPVSVVACRVGVQRSPDSRWGNENNAAIFHCPRSVPSWIRDLIYAADR